MYQYNRAVVTFASAVCTPHTAHRTHCQLANKSCSMQNGFEIFSVRDTTVSMPDRRIHGYFHDLCCVKQKRNGFQRNINKLETTDNNSSVSSR